MKLSKQGPTSDATRQARKRARVKYMKSDENRRKIKARAAVARAIETGRLRKLDCRCGSPDVHAHHVDYTRPLDVVWMCVKCHARTHHT